MYYIFLVGGKVSKTRLQLSLAFVPEKQTLMIFAHCFRLISLSGDSPIRSSYVGTIIDDIIVDPSEMLMRT
jgi:hypothetical protein